MSKFRDYGMAVLMAVAILLGFLIIFHAFVEAYG